jgi:hypothetical protein
MTIRTRAARIAAVAALTVGLVGLGAPANADFRSVPDPADATGSLNDIRRVGIDHTKGRVWLRIKVTDLRRSPGAGHGFASAGIYFDTKPGDKGPEYLLTTGLYSGMDYQLIEVEGFGTHTGEPMSCGHRITLDYKRDVVRGWVARACLKRPDAVRLAVKMVDDYDASHPVVDWLKGKKKFTRAVAYTP